MARDALIGYTGFVGSNILRQRPFDSLYNSSNIESIAGNSFDLVVCAGVRAEKWIANADPEADAARIRSLTESLQGVRARRFVLISTVDVFDDPVGVAEETTGARPSSQPYGINRANLEAEVAGNFDALIVRLPALYGHGLKKNVVYDLLHDHETHKIDSRGVFQFYGIDRVWNDMSIALEAGLRSVHLVTEPVSVAEVAGSAFGVDFRSELAATPAHYDLRTRHARLFGGQGDYLESREQVLDGIRRFVGEERARSEVRP